MKLYAYKNGSASAKALCEKLGIKRIKHEGKKIHVPFLINWGASVIKRNLTADVILNEPQYVSIAANKLKTFIALSEADLSIPEWTQSHEEAFKWSQQGFTVVARHKLTGHSGEGIEIYEDPDDFYKDGFVEAPLYTKYIPKKEEYRVHVFHGHAFFIQRKARKKDVPDDQVNWKIRNHGNGFIFAHQDIDLGDGAKQLAAAAVRAIGLDFGAVDLIWSAKHNKYYVLEVNTACGLEGTTLEKYAQEFNMRYAAEGEE